MEYSQQSQKMNYKDANASV